MVCGSYGADSFSDITVPGFSVELTGPGSHTMEVLLGSSLDTAMNFTFSVNGGNKMPLNEANLDALCPVPEFFIRYTSVERTV